MKMTFTMAAIVGIATMKSAICFAKSEHEIQPPNIVFMFADDLGYGDLGCYGHPYAKTPASERQ